MYISVQNFSSWSFYMTNIPMEYKTHKFVSNGEILVYHFVYLFFFIYTCSLYSSRGITVQYTVISLVQFSDDMHVQCAYIHQVFQSVKWIQLLYITITSFLITYCVKNKKNLYTICSLTVCFLFYMYIDL